jgi:hypothetical protein
MGYQPSPTIVYPEVGQTLTHTLATDGDPHH